MQLKQSLRLSVQQKWPNQVNAVADEDNSVSDLSVLTVESVSTLAGKGKQVLTVLTFCIEDVNHSKHKSSMVCQLDTGASCNMISYRDLSILIQNGAAPLDQSSVKLKKYDGFSHETTRKNMVDSRTQRQLPYSKLPSGQHPNKSLQPAESCKLMGLLQCRPL